MLPITFAKGRHSMFDWLGLRETKAVAIKVDTELQLRYFGDQAHQEGSTPDGRRHALGVAREECEALAFVGQQIMSRSRGAPRLALS
jgi:hypothetical protein